MIKDKKATIGETFNWIPAFLIIIFVLLVIYLPAIILISGKGGKTSKIEENNWDLVSIKTLEAVLETKINEKTIKEKILVWAGIPGAQKDFKEGKEKELLSKIEKILSIYKNDNCGYYFLSGSSSVIEEAYKTAGGAARGAPMAGSMNLELNHNAVYFQTASIVKNSQKIKLYLDKENKILADFYVYCENEE